MRWRNRMRTFIALVAAGLLVGCASAKIEDAGAVRIDADQARPDGVIVYDFEISGDGSKSLEEDARKAGEAAVTVVAEEVVARLKKHGIVATRATGTPPAGSALAIRGQFLDVDEGNRLARVVVGFGMGATEIHSMVQLKLVGPTGESEIDDFKVVAKGSKTPGIATPLGVGAATGMMVGAVVVGAATAAKEVLGPLATNAEDTAKQIAERVTKVYVQEGWLPKEALD
jgi:hypothetical protein